jgi:hypothetical protein
MKQREIDFRNETLIIDAPRKTRQMLRQTRFRLALLQFTRHALMNEPFGGHLDKNAFRPYSSLSGQLL